MSWTSSVFALTFSCRLGLTTHKFARARKQKESSGFGIRNKSRISVISDPSHK